MTTEYDTTAELVRDLTLSSVQPRSLELGKYHVLYNGDGSVHTLDLTGEKWLEFPARKRGTVTVRDVPSFVQYWTKHHDGSSEVYADFDAGTVTAVLDAHQGSAYEFSARWQEHRLILALQPTGPWKEWTALDGALMSQADFAEFVEDHARHVVAPTPASVTSADLMEIAQHFQAHTKVDFTSGHRVANGQTEFAWSEAIEASSKTGKGTIAIPNDFALGIQPYDDCDPMVIRARFRYRLNSGQLLLGYKLDDASGTARDAVSAIVAKLAEELDVTVMHGRPA